MGGWKAGIAISFSIVILIMPASLLAFKNEPDGFRGIKWGTNINDLPNMVLHSVDEDLNFYHRKNDKMIIGKADIQSIGYVFYKGRFCSVFIKFNDWSNFDILKETLWSIHGEAYRPNRFIDEYYWFWSDVSLGFDYSEISKKGIIIYNYEPITHQFNKEKKEIAKKGAGDL